MKRLALLLTILAAACGGDEVAEPDANEAARINGQIQNQAAQIVAQAENGTAEIERAMENEGAAVFENRAGLLNETAGNAAAAANQAR